MPLDIKLTSYGGLGVYVGRDVSAGETIFALPSHSMLHVPKGAQAMLPLILARERRNASSELMRRYLATLPSECPDNLATRGEDDLALAAESLHGWKVDLLRRERQAMTMAGWPMGASSWSDEEIRWATCMKLSRAFAGVGSGPVMMPFVDLLNHDHTKGDCRERGRWVDEATGQWVAEVVAERDLPQGTEVVYPYSESPSKARLLTSFGFSEGAASASLAASELPERDSAFLEANGCKGSARTDLVMADGEETLGDDALQWAVRCIRLALYEPEEAEWALRHGHLEAGWGGAGTTMLPNDAEAAQMLSSILQKDHRITSNTGEMCSNAQTPERRARQAELLDAASADLREAIREETAALTSCAEGFGAAQAAILERGQALFGGGDEEEDES